MMNLKEKVSRVRSLKQTMDTGQLNFAVPEQKQYLLDSLGGEPMLKDRYPAVYEAIERTAQAHSANANQDDLVMPISDQPALSGGGNENLLAAKGTGWYDINVCGKTWAAGNKDVPSMRMYSLLKRQDSNQPFDSASRVFHYDSQHADVPFALELSQSKALVQDEKKEAVVTACELIYTKKNLTLGCEPMVESTPFYVNGMMDFVKSFDVIDPKKKDETAQGPVRVMYGARSANNPDYKYPNVYEVDGKVKTYLPTKYRIELEDGFELIDISPDQSIKPKLQYSNIRVATYQGAAMKMNKLSKTCAELTLDEDWNDPIDAEKFHSSVRAVFSCPFYITIREDEFGSEIPYAFGVQTSLSGPFYHAQQNSQVYVPEIYYEWGCFGKNTILRMADGTQKSITQICRGDYVAVMDGGSARVEKVVTGFEEWMLHLETDSGNMLQLTKTHPVLTARGIVTACSLNISDRLVLEDGSFAKITALFWEAYYDAVYNLDTGIKPQLIAANGIWTGDYGQQNQLEAQPAEDMPQELKRLCYEFDRLDEELQKLEHR